MKHFFERSSAELRRLKQAIDDAFAHRSESKEAYELWQRACSHFHERYDSLAFPGGLDAALDRLSAGDLATAETAIDYLELSPHFYRSQYNATYLTRRLKKIPLPERLQRRFDAIRAAAHKRKMLRKTAQT